MVDPTTRPLHIEHIAASIDLPIAHWDREGRLVHCNEVFAVWASRAREALIGRSVRELFGDAAWAVAQRAFEDARNGRAASGEMRLAHGPMRGRWARVQAFTGASASGPIDTVCTIATDIHDEVVARNATAAHHRRLDRFIENIPYPLTYVDRDFAIRFVNKAYREVTSESAGNLIGQHIGKVRGAKRWAEHEPYFLRAMQGEATQYTRLVRSLPQGPRWLRTSYVPDLDDDGQVLGVYTVTIDVHDLAVAQEKLKRRVERDALTDVLSRRTMMDHIEAALADPARPSTALYFVDLDGFKAINDRLGHREGDSVLIAVGAALQAAVRAEDAVGRFGGDEFLVLAPVRDANGAHALALHMLAAIREAVGTRPIGSVVTASIGYALAPDDARHPLNLLQLADDAMYAAKRQGKNRATHCAAIPFEATR